MEGETEPIYNHFPDLPETSKMQWYGEASGGIGLNTVRVSVFAYYDHDITGERAGGNKQGAEVEDCRRCPFCFPGGYQGHTENEYDCLYMNRERFSICRGLGSKIYAAWRERGGQMSAGKRVKSCKTL